MKRAVILRRPLSHRMRPDLRPANDNDPPEPPPAASQHQRQLAPLMAAIATLGTNRLIHAAQAA
jgi:hypothetical protein